LLLPSQQLVCFSFSLGSLQCFFGLMKEFEKSTSQFGRNIQNNQVNVRTCFCSCCTSAASA
jgi:hypothetical protein